jgi:hypothetical protein
LGQLRVPLEAGLEVQGEVEYFLLFSGGGRETIGHALEPRRDCRRLAVELVDIVVFVIRRGHSDKLVRRKTVALGQTSLYTVFSC